MFRRTFYFCTALPELHLLNGKKAGRYGEDMPILLIGIDDPWVLSALVLAVSVTIVCMIYGILRWNKGDDSAPGTDTIIWVRDEKVIDEDL